jgi:hypothetical protein
MSKRFNLREFQQNVLERLQAQVAGGGDHASTLGVQVGEDYWLVDMVDINEVLPPPPLTPVPLTKPWYCGVANVRGTLAASSTPVYSAARDTAKGKARTAAGQSSLLMQGCWYRACWACNQRSGSVATRRQTRLRMATAVGANWKWRNCCTNRNFYKSGRSCA